MSKIKKSQKKVAIVTGGSSGIGQDIVCQMASDGCVIIVLDINEPEYALPDGSDFYQCDLSKTSDIEAIFEKLKNKYDSIDYLINNTRIRDKAGLYDIDEGQFAQSMHMGLFSPIYLIKQFSRYSVNKQQQRVIVNISSIAAQLVSSESLSYHIVKGGLDAMTRYLAVSLGNDNIRVNAVAPGFVVKKRGQAFFESEQNASNRDLAQQLHPTSQVGKGADIANIVSFLCNEKSRFINGQTIWADGGLCLRDGWEQATLTTNILEGR